MTYYVAPYSYRLPRRWVRPVEDNSPRQYSLAVDLREQDDAYVLQALVPGLKAEDLSIQVLEDVVTLAGEFKAGEDEYLLRELPHGSFQRSLRLPVSLEAGKAEARIQDGVLTLRLPKAEAARPKTIKIAVK